ncbi:hypothetical protein BD410DRAFT_809754 [Rickenella mellea]|uniref:Uncharacterized protein n=1 Tax=Rickenella mellea TaxID=50990 RepID=A0A4Y7PHD0_9AGAM|nr:hypothetical protein BD410DRAFT_809754 [Rickenella mellea]
MATLHPATTRRKSLGVNNTGNTPLHSPSIVQGAEVAVEPPSATIPGRRSRSIDDRDSQSELSHGVRTRSRGDEGFVLARLAPSSLLSHRSTNSVHQPSAIRIQPITNERRPQWSIGFQLGCYTEEDVVGRVQEGEIVEHFREEGSRVPKAMCTQSTRGFKKLTSTRTTPFWRREDPRVRPAQEPVVELPLASSHPRSEAKRRATESPPQSRPKKGKGGTKGKGKAVEVEAPLWSSDELKGNKSHNTVARRGERRKRRGDDECDEGNRLRNRDAQREGRVRGRVTMTSAAKRNKSRSTIARQEERSRKRRGDDECNEGNRSRK